MKRVVIIVVAFLLAFNFVRSQNYDQVLADLVQEKKWFEADRYFHKYKDSLRSDFVRQLYRAEAGRVFNRFDEAIEAYTQLIEKNYLKWDTLTLVGTFGQPLFNSYNSSYSYSGGAAACRLLISMVEMEKKADAKQRESYISSLRSAEQTYMKMQRQHSKLEVVEDRGNRESRIPLVKNNLNLISIKTSSNGIPLKITFDTGGSVPCFIWKKDMAKKLGVVMYPQDTFALGKGIRAVLGRLDSLRLGNIVVRNIQTYIKVNEVDKNDKVQSLCDSVLTSVTDMVIGLPIMLRVGKLRLNFEDSTLSMSPQHPTIHNLVERNLLIGENGLLQLSLKVFDDSFLAVFDTGNSVGMMVNSRFYTAHKEKFVLKKGDKVGYFMGGCFKENRTIVDDNWICDNLSISISNVTIPHGKDNRVSVSEKYDERYGTPEGGMVGTGIFKYIKEASFDFYCMNFSIVK